MMMERVAILQPDLLRKLYSRYFNKVIKCNQHSTKTLIFLIAYCPTLPEYSLRKLDIISYQSQDPRSSNSNDSKFASKQHHKKILLETKTMKTIVIKVFYQMLEVFT